jgi:preprotein translocase subunit YajC
MTTSVLDFFINTAFAADPSSVTAQGGGTSLFLMLIIFVVFMYFGIWRPQSKRGKEQRKMMESIAKGDEVVTAGGILGKVSKLADQYIILSLNDSVEMTVQKTSVVGILPKGTIKSIN